MKTKKTKLNNNQRIILASIIEAFNEIPWTTNGVQAKAYNFIVNFFNMYIYGNQLYSFSDYKNMTTKYWSLQIGTKNDRAINEIKKKLVEFNVLEEINGLYSKDSRVKSYRFNQSLIYNHSINKNIIPYIAVPFFNELIINELGELENSTKNTLKQVKVNYGDNWVHRLESIIDKQINKNFEIIYGAHLGSKLDDHIPFYLNNKKYRWQLKNVLDKANELNAKLIRWGDKYYIIINTDNFIQQKRIDLRIIYEVQLKDIETNNIRTSINDTNGRLDSNVTNLQSDLWDFLTLDDEELLEIDGANFQFVIPVNITDFELDDIYIKEAVNGTLYDYGAKQLNIERSEFKSLMMRFAFDKCYKDKYQEIKEIFPIFYQSVWDYKQKNGYKALSILLQRTESNIMIKHVYYRLHQKYKLLTVHDAIRCKESDYENVLNDVKKIFKEINFKCLMRNKYNQKH